MARYGAGVGPSESFRALLSCVIAGLKSCSFHVVPDGNRMAVQAFAAGLSEIDPVPRENGVGFDRDASAFLPSNVSGGLPARTP